MAPLNTIRLTKARKAKPIAQNGTTQPRHSAFDRSARHAFDKTSLHDKKKHDHRRDDKERGGHDLAPVAAVLPAERVEPHDGCLLVMALVTEMRNSFPVLSPDMIATVKRPGDAIGS